MASEDIDVTYPNGATMPVSVLDDAIKTLAVGLQDFLDVDHYCTLDGNSFPATSAGGGKHKWIEFKAVLASAPTAGEGEGILYIYPDPDDSAVELWWESAADAPRQLTLDGAINLVEADFATVIGDNTILSFDVNSELTLLVDDSTIEYDAVNGLQIKVPDADGSGTTSEACFVITGTYTGNNSADRDITIGDGIEVRHVVIKGPTASYNGCEMINRGGGDYRSWGQPAGANLGENLKPATNGFWVDNSTPLNANGVIFAFCATCTRM